MNTRGANTAALGRVDFAHAQTWAHNMINARGLIFSDFDG